MSQVLLNEGELSASSPDELAFVAAAEHFGFEFAARRDAHGELDVTDKRLGVTHTIKARRAALTCPLLPRTSTLHPPR